MLYAFRLGIAERMQFKASLVGDILSLAIRFIFLLIIWRALVGKDFVDYYTTLIFLVPSFRYIYHPLEQDYEHAIRKGWHVAFAKPLSPFVFQAAYTLGLYFPTYLISLIFGLAYFSLKGVFPLLPLIFAIFFSILFDIALAYFTTAFSYFVYTLWGLRVLFNISNSMLGGFILPLSLLNREGQHFLLLLPFGNRNYALALSLLSNSLPLAAYANIAAWSIALFIAGFIIHRAGWKHFESQGG